MFTGLIEELGTLVDLSSVGTSLCLKIEAERVFSGGPEEPKNSQNGLKIGDSIAVNGVCLTATLVKPPYFEVTAVEETIGKTTLGSLTAGRRINLERAATIETRLGGHLVQGHADGVATLRDIRDADGSWEFTFELPQDSDRYVVPRGSIALDGISLTVAEVTQTSVCDPSGGSQTEVASSAMRATIAIIPHTYYHTNVQFLNIGDRVNVELDVIAKMVERLVKPYKEFK
ncbi:MAG TPA: riboflavin synthase [Candidatus Kapabacteria bacterium]|nr:riboflavin synthase [Candidatus Kapabacteria bacterium]